MSRSLPLPPWSAFLPQWHLTGGLSLTDVPRCTPPERMAFCSTRVFWWLLTAPPCVPLTYGTTTAVAATVLPHDPLYWVKQVCHRGFSGLQIAQTSLSFNNIRLCHPASTLKWAGSMAPTSTHSATGHGCHTLPGVHEAPDQGLWQGQGPSCMHVPGPTLDASRPLPMAPPAADRSGSHRLVLVPAYGGCTPVGGEPLGSSHLYMARYRAGTSLPRGLWTLQLHQRWSLPTKLAQPVMLQLFRLLRPSQLLFANPAQPMLVGHR
jgi:hypothetical protein